MTPAQYLADQVVLGAIDQQRLAAGYTAEASHILLNLQDDLTRLMGSSAKGSLASRLKDANASITRTFNALGKVVDVGGVGDVYAFKAGKDLGYVFSEFETYTPKASAVAKAALVQGHKPDAWWSRQAENVAFQFKALAQGKPEDAMQQLESMLQTTANQAKSLIYSTTNTAAAEGRMKAYVENPELVKGLRQVSILDGRTTPKCTDYAGCTWTLDLKPTGKRRRPYVNGCPRHFGCRSVIVPTPILDAVSNPTLKKYGRAIDIADDTTFSKWIATQETEVQDEILGKGKLALYERGTLTLSQLLDSKRNPITLARLREKYQKANR